MCINFIQTGISFQQSGIEIRKNVSYILDIISKKTCALKCTKFSGVLKRNNKEKSVITAFPINSVKSEKKIVDVTTQDAVLSRNGVISKDSLEINN